MATLNAPKQYQSSTPLKVSDRWFPDFVWEPRGIVQELTVVDYANDSATRYDQATVGDRPTQTFEVYTYYCNHQNSEEGDGSEDTPWLSFTYAVTKIREIALCYYTHPPCCIPARKFMLVCTGTVTETFDMYGTNAAYTENIFIKDLVVTIPTFTDANRYCRLAREVYINLTLSKTSGESRAIFSAPVILGGTITLNQPSAVGAYGSTATVVNSYDIDFTSSCQTNIQVFTITNAYDCNFSLAVVHPAGVSTTTTVRGTNLCGCTGNVSFTGPTHSDVWIAFYFVSAYHSTLSLTAENPETVPYTVFWYLAVLLSCSSFGYGSCSSSYTVSNGAGYSDTIRPVQVGVAYDSTFSLTVSTSSDTATWCVDKCPLYGANTVYNVTLTGQGTLGGGCAPDHVTYCALP